MKIQDVLRKDVMLLDLQATSKEAVIDEMIASLVDKGYVTDFEVFKTGILNREATVKRKQQQVLATVSQCHTLRMQL